MSLAPGEILIDRQRRAQAGLGGLGIDALLVTSLPNVFYLSNHGGSAGVILLTDRDADLLVDARYAEAVEQRQASPAACPGLRVRNVPASYDQAIVECIRELGCARVGIEAGHMTVARHAWLTEALAAVSTFVELRQTSNLIEYARTVKDAHEQEQLRQAASSLGPVAEAAFGAVWPGATERDVAGAIEGAMRLAGYDRTAFDTIVGSGPNGARPHHQAGDRRIDVGDLVVLDFGGVLDGYCSDLTRTVSVGECSAKSGLVYAAVLDAQRAAIEAIRPGVAASEVDAAARRVLDDRGLGHAFTHGTGHGLGLEVHESPRVARSRSDTGASEAILRPGMVFTVEPGAYLPGWGGVRIEDDVLVTEEGYEVLTSVTRELLML